MFLAGYDQDHELTYLALLHDTFISLLSNPGMFCSQRDLGQRGVFKALWGLGLDKHNLTYTIFY